MRVEPDFIAWIERRLRARGDAKDDLDIVLGPDPERTLRWIRERARLADGTESFLPVASAGSVLSALAAIEADVAALTARTRLRGTTGALDTLSAGLLREAASLTWEEIAKRTGCTLTTARNRWTIHRTRLLEVRVLTDRIGRGPDRRTRDCGRGPWR
jgi:hypothetical protein